MVAKLLVLLVKEKNNYIVSACFPENTYLLILKIVPKAALEFLFRLSYAVNG